MNPVASSLRSAGVFQGKATLLLAIMAVGLMSLLFGLVAVTAEPVPVALAASLLIGLSLIARPVWMIWLILIMGLLVAGVVPIWAEGAANRAVWGISAIGFALMGVAFFYAVTRPGATKGTPGFVWLALAFIVYTLLNTLWQFSTVYEALSGFKRYFQATGLLFALAWLPIGERDIRQWRKFFVIVALFQLPWAVYQLVELVPIRESFRHAYPGLVPIDVVAGTFGSQMRAGGANAEMATFLLIVLAFFLARLRVGQISKIQLLWLLPMVLAPLFIGETKAVVVMLPLLFLTLYRRELFARPHVALVGLLVGTGLTIGASLAYLSITQKSLEDQVAETLSYNVYEVGYGNFALNRTTVLTFWANEQGLDDPTGALLGHGLGTAHDATGGDIASRYPGYGVSLTAASSLLWEQGLVGSLLFLMVLAFAWKTANGVRHSDIAPAWAKADAAAIQASLPLFAFYLIYRSVLIELMTFQIVFYALLGYLAWMARRYVTKQDT